MSIVENCRAILQALDDIDALRTCALALAAGNAVGGFSLPLRVAVIDSLSLFCLAIDHLAVSGIKDIGDYAFQNNRHREGERLRVSRIRKTRALSRQ